MRNQKKSKKKKKEEQKNRRTEITNKNKTYEMIIINNYIVFCLYRSEYSTHTYIFTY